MAATLYTVEEVTARLQITSRTLHYYEELGLIPPAARTSGGHRMYDQSALERLEHILRIKTALGASLQDISAILTAEENLEQLKAQYRGEVSDEEKQHILEQGAELLTSLVDSIDEKIERLSKLRESFQQRLDKVNRRRQEQEQDQGQEAPPS